MNIFQKIALGIFFALAAMASSADFITPIAVTASSFWSSNQTPNNLINSSGLSANNAAATHDADGGANTMWFAGAGAPLSCKVSDTPFLTLDGTNDYIALNMSYTGKNIAELTVEAWVKTTFSHSGNFNNWAIVDFDRSEFYNLFVAGNGRVGFSTYSQSNGNIKDFYSGSGHTVNDGQWHHIAGVYDGTDKIIYIDGVEVARQVNPHSGADLGRNNRTRWGFIGDGSEAGSYNANRNNFYYDGSIDEIRIWHVARTATQINSYKSLCVDGQANLEAYYKADEQAGTTLTDYSGNGHTGTFFNFSSGPTAYPVVASQSVTFDLGQAYNLTQAYIWQMNQHLSGRTDLYQTRGVASFDIETSLDGVTYTQLGATQTLNVAGGVPGEPAQVKAMSVNNVRYVRFDIRTAHGGAPNEYVGLSEVRFEGTPVSPSPPVVAGVLCNDIFTDAVQNFTNSGNKIELKNAILQNTSGTLDTDNLTGSDASSACGGSCSESGSPSAQDTIVYLDGSGSTDIQLNSGGSYTAGDAASGGSGIYDFDDVELDDNTSMTFLPNPSGPTVYYIDDWENDGDPDNVTITFAPGDYWTKGHIDFDDNLTINISPPGQVRWYIGGGSNGKLHLKGSSNSMQINAAGPPSNFIIYAEDEIKLEDGEQMKGYLYAEDKIEIKKGSYVQGALSSQEIKLKDSPDSTVNFEPFAATVDGGAFCDASSVASAVTHYHIQPTTPSVTCELGTVVIEPHDASHTALPNDGTTITLSTTPANDGWTKIIGAGALTGNQYTFAGGETSATFGLAKTSAATLDIDVSDGSATDLDGDAAEDIDITFNDVGFRFYGNNAVDGVGNQIAGKPSNSAPGSQTLSIRAIQTDPATGQCAALINGGSVPVGMAYTCNNPQSCAQSSALNIAGTNISGSNAGGSLNYSNVALNFDATGTANFVMSFADAGQITIAANADVAVGNTAVTVQGSSNPFVVRPFGFDVDLVLSGSSDRASNGTGGNSYASNSGGSVFATAGSNFLTRITAMQWQAGDDSNQDGVPDSGANLANNAATLNFGQEISPEVVSISHSLVAPAGGSLGSLSAGSGSSFTNGMVEKNFNWSEVGIINLQAQLADNNYLASGIDVTGSAANVGRFVPARFLLTDPSVTEACVGGAYSYMGESFTLAFKASAVNSSNTITTNYRDGFIKLGASQGTLQFGAMDQTSSSNLTSRLVPDGVSLTAASTFLWGPNMGVALGVGELETDVKISRGAAPDGLFAAAIGVLVSDADGVANEAFNLDVDGGGNDFFLLGSSSQRYGRIFLENSFGPESRDLAVPFVAQHYDAGVGSGTFVRNSSDSCSALAVGDFNEVSGSYTANLSASDTQPSSVSASNYIAGEGSVILSAPGSNNDGSVDIEFTVPEHLRYDWDADPSTADTSPINTATFGSFRGNDRIIYRGEVLQ